MAQRVLATIIGATLVGVVVVALAGLGVVALAQGGVGHDCEGCDLAASGACSENAEVITVTGVVAETVLDQETAALILGVADQSPVRVELGPPTTLEGLGVTARVGDRLVVTGHYTADGTALVAHTIADEGSGQSFVFCDESGHPLWAGESCSH